VTASTTTVPFHLAGNYAPVRSESTVTELAFEGTIPAQLAGCYVRNGPNPRPGGATGHWFYGDGMVHGVAIADGRPQWYRSRWIRTATFTHGAPLLGADLTIDRRAGVANTNVVRHAGRTFALVETSFPYLLDDELGTLGPHDFDGRLHTAMTAHPKVCPSTGELHFFGYGLMPPYVTYQCADASGQLVRSVEINVSGPTMMHDFAITDRYVLFLDLPVVFDAGLAATGAMPFRWDDTYGARIGLMSRDPSKTTVAWYEIEPCYVFHVMNAYDDGEGVVLDALRYAELWRAGTQHFGAATLHRWTIDAATGAATEQPLDDCIAEFPRIDDRRTGRRHRYGYAVAQADPDAGAILRYDLDLGATQHMSVGDGRFPSEAVFVAGASEREDDGHLITFVYDVVRDQSDLVILDAGEPDRPPVATIHLGRRVPFGFHGNWFPAPTSAP
jgi:carotenoid cleavage dioxygenase